MKLNLPSTLTQQTAWSLFFLTLFNIQQTEAGNAFRNCLRDKFSDTTSYDLLIKNPFTSLKDPVNGFVGDPLGLCCSATDCYQYNDQLSSLCIYQDWYFECTKVSQGVYCYTYYYLYRGGDKSVRCGGMIGDKEITTSYAQEVIGYSYYCTDYQIQNISSLTNKINAQTLDMLDKGYASADKALPSLSSVLSWDNNGWIYATFTCFLQWPAPWSGPADKNPTTYIYNPTSTVILPTSTNFPNLDNHLVEKIAIPVGSVTGVSLTSILTYYFCKKKKRKAKLMLTNQLSTETNDLGDHNNEIELDKKDNSFAELNHNFTSNHSELEHNSAQSEINPVFAPSELERSSVLTEQNSSFVQSEQNNLLFNQSEQKSNFVSELSEQNSSFVLSEQKIEFEEPQSQSINQWSVVNNSLAKNQWSSDNSYQPQLITFTPPTSPMPQLVEKFSIKQLHLNELKEKLSCHYDLWTDYLEIKQVLANNPHSRITNNSFNNLQQQLLQILTISEIGLLLEDNHNYHVTQQTEYTAIIEETRNPQAINYRNPQWRG